MIQATHVEVVNIVGSGDLDVEIDLQSVESDIPEAEYDINNYHGLYLRFGEESPLTTVYRSGKYIITGAKSETELLETRESTHMLFQEMDLFHEGDDDKFSIQNFVCKGNLDRNINLNALTIGLGLESVEYEPEQFPGLVFRPENYGCVLLVFGSGEVILTGAKTIEDADQAFLHIQELVEELLD